MRDKDMGKKVRFAMTCGVPVGDDAPTSHFATGSKNALNLKARERRYSYIKKKIDTEK